MLKKLQKNTLIKSQVLGYSAALFIGVSIILIVFQVYLDTKPLLTQQSEVFKGNFAVISKNISVFKTIDKEKIYFTEKEINELESQSFSRDVSTFKNATFKIKAFSNKSENVPVFYTDLFFESISDKYLDVKTDEWDWDASMDFIPIMIPENYLNLYNFGFAESQGLPVLSKNTISQIDFKVRISGNNKSKDYNSKIVGFSNKINSILVPDSFLKWANIEFGRSKTIKTSRILIEFNNPSDEKILEYFNNNNFSINKEKLEFSKLVFFFNSALFFVFFIAFIIVILSVSFILLSMNLIIQRNKEMMINLYNIGYSHHDIAKFYQIVISLVTILSIITSILISNYFRFIYLQKFSNLFEMTTQNGKISLIGTIVLLILLLIFNFLVKRNIKKTIYL